MAPSYGGRRHGDAEDASLAHDAVDFDASAMLGHAGVADRQPETGAATRRLGREERLENLLPVGAPNALTTVDHLGDRDAALVVGTGSQGDDAFLVDSIECIEDQCHEHLN